MSFNIMIVTIIIIIKYVEITQFHLLTFETMGPINIVLEFISDLGHRIS